MSDQPTKPTQPPAPIEAPNRRPGGVTLAGLLMIAGAVVGLISAIALYVASGDVVQGFRDRAVYTDATPSDIDTVAKVIRSVFLVGATATLVLAIIVAVLSYGVLRGINAIRIITVVLLVFSLCCGVGSSSYTAFGRNANWTVNVDNADPELARQVGQAYSDAIPTWLVGTTGGLSCVQMLSYLAVIVLLFLPGANSYFRRRPVPPAGGQSGPQGPQGPQEPAGYSPSGYPGTPQRPDAQPPTPSYPQYPPPVAPAPQPPPPVPPPPVPPPPPPPPPTGSSEGPTS